MAEKDTSLNELLFIGLILNLQASAMMALGKIVNPMTQKVERNLDQARMTIDMLGMLEEKTKGNCTDEEVRTLSTALTELRMNYVDELEKDKKEREKEGEKLDTQAAQAESETEKSEGTGADEAVAGEKKSGEGSVTEERPSSPGTAKVQVETPSGKKAKAPRKKSRKSKSQEDTKNS